MGISWWKTHVRKRSWFPEILKNLPKTAKYWRYYIHQFFCRQLTEKQNKAGQRRLIDWMNDYPIIDYMNVDEVIILIEMTNFRLRGTLYFDLIADKNLVQTSKNIHRRTNILFSFGNISCSCMLGHDSNVQIQTIFHRLLCFFILYINVDLIPPFLWWCPIVLNKNIHKAINFNYSTNEIHETFISLL